MTDPQDDGFLLVKCSAQSGRVLHLDLPEVGVDSPVASIRILSQPSHGHVSVNPDQTLSLVLSEDPANTAATAFSYEITYHNGSTQNVTSDVEVTAGTQKAGWSLGDYYMLEEGRDGSVVIEHGENHRKVHITAGEDGLDKADIARMEGLSAKTITAAWLEDHPEYGATPDKALSTDLGMALWQKLKAAQ